MIMRTTTVHRRAVAPIAADPTAQALARCSHSSMQARPIGHDQSLTATAATSAAVPLSGLAVEIAANVQSGKSSFEMRLDPADLGRIDVRIQIDRTARSPRI